MGEAAVIFPDQAGGEPDLEAALFHRKIEFQLATKPFNGFGSGTSDGFKLVTLNPNAETNKAAGSVKNCEKMELFEAGLDPDLSFTITFRRIGAGLRNLGNTCFLNSVLQCLTYTEPLAAYLQSGKHQSSCRKAGFCALCAIQKHVGRALQSTGRILEPKDLVSNLRCISRSFRNARQEDAHEYMVNLLESMHKCCLPSGVPSESPSAYEKSLIHRIFGGRLRSQVKCMQCSFCSNKFDPFLDLSLEIVKADSLIKALAHFTAKEHLDGGFKVYQCQHCKQKVKALKQLTVHKAPHVLAVHLKRFSSHLQGQKIDKKVAFGPTLNLKPFVTGPFDGDLNYTLYGVLVHAGWSTHSGHYYCYVRTSSGMWYSLDDNQVIQVNERTVLEQKAYMLFYVRDRTTFSTKKSVEIVTKENMVLNAFKGTASSKFNVELTGKIQNVLIEKKPVEAFSASLSHRVPVVSSSPKKAPSINEFSDDLNVPVADNCMAFEADPHAEHLSGPPPTENNLKYHSSLPNSNGNGQVPPTENNLKDHSSLENSSGNGPVQPTENNLKVHSSLPKSSGNGQVPPAENNMKDHSSLLKSSGNGQVGCSSGNTAVNSTMLESHENGIEGSKSVACGVRTNKKPCLKVRKKLLKYHFAATSLSSSIILCSVLRTEKKNQKLRKRHSGQKKDPNLKVLLAGSGYRANAESSVSERSLPTVVECAHSQKKNVESCSVGNKQSLSLQSIVDSLNGSMDPDVRKRIVPDSTTLSIEKPLVWPSTARRPAEDGGWESRQAEVMSMLTRGLDKTIVTRWDGIDVSPAEQIVTPAAGPVQIGYIGDEWDEEYDRGKRKKIRGPRIGFDGSNLFQELSTRNLERKRAKLNRSSSENRPFRI